MIKKNYKQWNVPHYVWDDIEHFMSLWKYQDGIHTIHFGPTNSPIDFFVNDLKFEAAITVQPIFFAAAVSKRAEKIGPFFTGLGLSKRANVPFISVADPSLDEDPALNLAWYTGAYLSSFTQNLDQIISFICNSLQREPLFIGGSGGGFAAIATAVRFELESNVLVWNPQTDIFLYEPKIVHRYLRSRFGLGNKSLQRDDWIEFCRLRTDKEAATSVVSALGRSKVKRLVYLQNTQDWHLQKHLQPFWNSLTEERLKEGKNYYTPNHLVHLGKFAEGHAPPPESVIRKYLQLLMNKNMRVLDSI